MWGGSGPGRWPCPYRKEGGLTPRPPAPATQDGRTPLHYAALNGHKDVAALLLERGADKEAKNNVSVPMHVGPAAALPHTSVDERSPTHE